MYQDVIKARQLVNEDLRHIYPRLFLAVVILAALASCDSQALEVDVDNESEGVANAAAIPVRVAYVSDDAVSETLRFAGVARPRQRANLSFQVGGNIEKRFAEIGEQVQAGDIVARLYNPQLGPAADAAEARLAQLIHDSEQAERDLDRLQRIYEQGLLAIQDLEQQRTLLRRTQAAIDNARAIVAQNQQIQRESELRAPFSGRIEQVLLEPGEFAQPGQPVIRMSAEQGMEVEVRVPPHMLYGLNLGDAVPIWHGLSGEELMGRIKEIGEGSSGNSALYPLVVSLEQTELRSGEALEVGVAMAQDRELSIPLNAVLRSAEGLSVFKVSQSDQIMNVSRVPVDVKRITGDRVILEPGSLQLGDSVVYAGITRLAEGDAIRVLNAASAVGGVQ